MIVYRDQRTPVQPAQVLDALRESAANLGPRPDHDALVRLLVELGMLESAVADACHPVRDDEDDLGRRFRSAIQAAAHLVRLSWRGRPAESGSWRAALRRRLEALDPRALPPRVHLLLPEGYAQYGLYPECYLEAADRFAEECRPEAAVCVGIRSIGTSLSGMAAAALEARGVPVESHTVRPRGHPFDRRIELGPTLAAGLARNRRAHFLVVDEGPGISGSSFAAAADALGRLGVPDARIVLLPSWETDGSSLRSAAARARWPRHRRYVVTFEEAWLPSGRLERAARAGPLEDLSAGAWRDALLPADAPRPAVHPQHERRKYRSGDVLLSFAGLGGLAERRLERAHALADAGFGPAPRGTAGGFLARDLVPGRPVVRGGVDGVMIETVAAYLAHLHRSFRREPVPRDELTEMVEVNVAEALGPAGSRLLERHRKLRGEPATDGAVALDGRMLPHEWIRTARGYLKVDALDHHDDHFFPGVRDIAWDVAGAGIELGLDAGGRSRLLERYASLARDRTIAARLPACAVAYLAFRVGYATLASETLGDSPDGRRFAAHAAEYAALLHAELAAPGQARWSA